MYVAPLKLGDQDPTNILQLCSVIFVHCADTSFIVGLFPLSVSTKTLVGRGEALKMMTTQPQVSDTIQDSPHTVF